MATCMARHLGVDVGRRVDLADDRLGLLLAADPEIPAGGVAQRPHGHEQQHGRDGRDAEHEAPAVLALVNSR